jgi:hypothetical protein
LLVLERPKAEALGYLEEGKERFLPNCGGVKSKVVACFGCMEENSAWQVLPIFPVANDALFFDEGGATGNSLVRMGRGFDSKYVI